MFKNIQKLPRRCQSSVFGCFSPLPASPPTNLRGFPKVLVHQCTVHTLAQNHCCRIITREGYYYTNGHQQLRTWVHIPPTFERGGNIISLVLHFLQNPNKNCWHMFGYIAYNIADSIELKNGKNSHLKDYKCGKLPQIRLHQKM